MLVLLGLLKLKQYVKMLENILLHFCLISHCYYYININHHHYGNIIIFKGLMTIINPILWLLYYPAVNA